MGAMLRCDGCGSIRWDVLGLNAAEKGTCATCGEPLKLERRRPGRRASTRRFASKAAAERRDLVPPPAA
jgi:rRNA maturation endonuclease Nob1